jgi:type VI secretion system protein ImpF
MPRWEPEQTVTQSVLERLLDLEPATSTEPAPTRAQSVRQLKAALRRDLEWLLNTRRRPDAVGSEYRELEQSLFNYGLPDMTSLNWEAERDRYRLARMLEQALRTFEPRIERLKVVPLEPAPGMRHVLRFQIEGMLEMDPAPEPISFDTMLQLTSGEYQVKGDAGAG